MPAILRGSNIVEGGGKGKLTRRDFLKLLASSAIATSLATLGISRIADAVVYRPETPSKVITPRDIEAFQEADAFVWTDKNGNANARLRDGTVIGPSRDHAEVLQEAIKYVRDIGGRLYIAPGIYTIKHDIVLPNSYGDVYAIAGATLPAPTITDVVKGTVLVFDGAKLLCEYYDKVHGGAYITLENLMFEFRNISDAECAKLSAYTIWNIRNVVFRTAGGVNVGALVVFGFGTDNSGHGAKLDHVYFHVSPNDKVDVIVYQNASWYMWIKPHVSHWGAPSGKFNYTSLKDIGTRKYGFVVKGYGNLFIKPHLGDLYNVFYSTGYPPNIVQCPVDGKFTGILDSAGRPSLAGSLIIEPEFETSEPAAVQIVESQADYRVVMTRSVNTISPVDLGELPTDPANAPGPYTSSFMKATIRIPAGTYSAGNKLSYYFKSYMLWKTTYSLLRRVIHVVLAEETDLPIVVRGIDLSQTTEFLGKVEVIFVGDASPSEDVLLDIYILIL